MKVTVIYNPTAGGGREALLCRFVAELERQGASVRLYYTKGPNDATDYLNGLPDQGDCVVAVGGDGTTNEVLNGLASGVALGVFATGTANVLAKELGLPKKPEQAAQVVMQGKSVSVTPARLNGRRFIMMCGIGYDAWVVNGVNLGIKERFGKLAYVQSMLSQIGRYGQRHYRVEVDGRPLDCFSAIITNGRHYGGSFVLSNEANILRPQVQVLLFSAGAGKRVGERTNGHHVCRFDHKAIKNNPIGCTQLSNVLQSLCCLQAPCVPWSLDFAELQPFRITEMRWNARCASSRLSSLLRFARKTKTPIYCAHVAAAFSGSGCCGSTSIGS